MPSLNGLRRIVQEVSSATSLDDSLRIITEQVKSVMEVDVSSIYLVDPETQALVLMFTQGLDPAAVGRVRLQLGDGLVGLVGERQQLLNIQAAPTHPNYRYFPETHEEKFNSFLGVPIVHYRKLLGVLVVQQTEARLFDSQDEAFMVTIAAQLAGSLSHAINSGKVSSFIHSRHLTNSFVNGISGSDGIGIGQVVVPAGSLSFKSIPEQAFLGIEQELDVFAKALAFVTDELADGRDQMADTPGDVQAIFDAYRMILEAPDLQDGVRKGIREGQRAALALRSVIEQHAAIFEAMEDAYFQARGEDIRNIGLRVLRYLVEPEAPDTQYPLHSILVGEVVSVSDIAQVPPERLAGIVCQQGSALSHTAILASALGVPAVMGVGELPLRMLAGQKAIIDGHQGRVHFNPSSALVSEFSRLAREESNFDRSLDCLKDEPAETLDGHRVALYVNTGLLSDITPGLERGAEGVGLYRTEIPFMVHETFPSEEEQYHIYRKVLRAFHPLPVTMRTLDIGGDKPLPYLPVREDNPYLGWRGIRFTLDHPEIFLGQLRAMLRASVGLNNLKILLPMVSRVDEVDGFLRLLERAMRGLQEEGFMIQRPPVGTMIEVPASMFMLDFLAWRLDFVSIGTNDLTQYLLAVDRNNEQVARLFSRLHPAVIRALHYITEQCRKHGLSVCLCGELAADPAAVLLLLGMGVDALSMNARSLPRIKHVLRSVTKEQAEGLVVNALRMQSEEEVRKMLNRALEGGGLKALVR